MNSEIRHQCLIYDGPPSVQLPILSAVIKQKLEEGYRCMYFNSVPMVTGVRCALAARGIDVVNEVNRTRLVLSSEPFTSSDGGFDIDLIIRNLEIALDQALNDGYKGLWASGDMTWELGSEKNFSKLVEYESRLEKVFQQRPEISGICQYHKNTLPNEVLRQSLVTHRGIFINETLSRVNPHYASPGLSKNNTATDAELDDAVTAICQAHE